MKILLVNYEYKPQCGGAGFATYNLPKEFATLGHDVELLIGWDYNFGEPEILPNVKTYIVKLKKKSIHESSPLGILEFIIKGTFLISKITKEKEYDIIQFFFSVPTGILKYGIKNNIPYVCSLRGIDVPSSRKDKYAFLRNMLNYVNKNIVMYAKAITALSSELASWFNEAYPDLDVNIIPNGLDYRKFKKKEGYSKKITKFVTVARLIECKNIELSIRAFKRIHEEYPNVRLDIIGDGYLRQRLENTILEENMRDYIELKGYVEPQEIANSLCEYDVFYLLTVADSFGQVFIEAMASGLPVICADIGGPKDIVVDGETGIKVLPNSEEDTIKALRFAVENPDVMKTYGENGHERVIKEYSIESVAKKHIDIYQEILKTRGL